MNRAEIEALLERWMAGYAPSSRRIRASDLRSFARWKGQERTEALCSWLSLPWIEAERQALAYRDACRARVGANRTVNRLMAALRTVSRLARRFGLTTWELQVPFLPWRGGDYRDTRGPSRAQLGRLFEAAAEEETRDPVRGSRWRAILCLLHDMALRISEAAAVNLEDLDLPGSRLMARRKAGGGEREWRPVPPSTLEALQLWIERRGNHPGAFLCTFPGKRFGVTSIDTALETLSRRAGIEPQVTANALRHASITRALVETDGDLLAVQSFSRHADIGTVLIYRDNAEDAAGRVSRLVAYPWK